MEVFQKKISNLIQSQFPEYYQDEGPQLVNFVTEYYRWLELPGNELYYQRRFDETIDVDECLEQFLLYKKEKYLKNIQLKTNSSTRMLIKHSLDLYKSKGTARSVDLLFRLVFGVGASVYLPGDDVFRTSASKWVVPRYLEVSLNEHNIQFYNKQIIGLNTGAKAFVERVVRKKVHDRYIDVFYISAIKGDFEVGEKINFSSNPIRIADCPDVIGSLTEIEVNLNGSGSGYVVGDIIPVMSDSGVSAKARVSAVSSRVGVASFNLKSGGYGYSNTSEVLISEKIISVSNVTVNTEIVDNYTVLFEKLNQPLAQISYLNASGTLVQGSNVYTYHANNLQKGQGLITRVEASNSTAGIIRLQIVSGNLIANNFYTSGNTISANVSVIDGYTDLSATANVIGVSSNISILATNVVSTYLKGDLLYQLHPTTNSITAQATLRSVLSASGANSMLNMTLLNGVFIPGRVFYNERTLSTSNLHSLNLELGVKDIVNQFNVANSVYNGYTSTSQTAVSGYISEVSLGTGASYTLHPDVIDGEYIQINTDLIADYANVALNATVYNFPGQPTGNLTNGIIDQILTYVNTEIGSVYQIFGSSGGSDYNKPPLTFIYEPWIYRLHRRSHVWLTVANTTLFTIGEKLTQPAINSRGRVLSINNNVIYVERMRVLPDNDFVITSNATTIIAGDVSGKTANVIAMYEDDTSDYMGINALVDAEVNTSNGAISKLQVIDSGFGFLDQELLTIGTSPNQIEGFAVLKKQGTGLGYWEDRTSFTSDNKYLFDGRYYQDFSYEIQSSVPVDKYKELVKQVVHAVGTQFFGAFVYDKVGDLSLNISSEPIQVSNT